MDMHSVEERERERIPAPRQGSRAISIAQRSRWSSHTPAASPKPFSDDGWRQTPPPSAAVHFSVATRRLLRLHPVLAAGLLAGCTTFQGEPPVDIMLSDVAPGEGGGVGDAPLNLVIRLENSSAEPLTIDGGA